MFGSLLSWSIDNGRGSTANFRATIIAEFIKTTHDAPTGVTMSTTPLLLPFSKETYYFFTHWILLSVYQGEVVRKKE